MFSSGADIHAVLALAGSKVAPGANAAASVTALRLWIIGLVPNAATQVVAMPPTAHEQGISITNLSSADFLQLLVVFGGYMPWGAATVAAGRSAGGFHIMLGTGVGSCTVSRVPSMGFA